MIMNVETSHPCHFNMTNHRFEYSVISLPLSVMVSDSVTINLMCLPLETPPETKKEIVVSS